MAFFLLLFILLLVSIIIYQTIRFCANTILRFVSKAVGDHLNKKYSFIDPKKFHIYVGNIGLFRLSKVLVKQQNTFEVEIELVKSWLKTLFKVLAARAFNSNTPIHLEIHQVRVRIHVDKLIQNRHFRSNARTWLPKSRKNLRTLDYKPDKKLKWIPNWIVEVNELSVKFFNPLREKSSADVAVKNFSAEYEKHDGSFVCSFELAVKVEDETGVLVKWDLESTVNRTLTIKGGDRFNPLETSLKWQILKNDVSLDCGLLEHVDYLKWVQHKFRYKDEKNDQNTETSEILEPNLREPDNVEEKLQVPQTQNQIENPRDFGATDFQIKLIESHIKISLDTDNQFNIKITNFQVRIEERELKELNLQDIFIHNSSKQQCFSVEQLNVTGQQNITLEKISLKMHETNLVKVFKAVQLKVLPHIGKLVQKETLGREKQRHKPEEVGDPVLASTPVPSTPLHILLKTLDFQLCNDTQENICWLRIMTTNFRKQDETYSLATEALVFYEILEIKDFQMNFTKFQNGFQQSFHNGFQHNYQNSSRNSYLKSQNIIAVNYSKLQITLSSNLTNFIISITTIFDKFEPLIDEFKTQLAKNTADDTWKLGKGDLFSPVSETSSSSHLSPTSPTSPTSPSSAASASVFPNAPTSPTSQKPSSTSLSSRNNIFQNPIFTSKFKIQLNQTSFSLKNCDNTEVAHGSFDIGVNVDKNDLSIYISKLSFKDENHVLVSDTMFDIKYKRNLNIISIVGNLPTDNTVTSPGLGSFGNRPSFSGYGNFTTLNSDVYECINLYWDTISHKSIHDAVMTEIEKLKPIFESRTPKTPEAPFQTPQTAGFSDFQQPVQAEFNRNYRASFARTKNPPYSQVHNSTSSQPTVLTSFLNCPNITLKIPEIKLTIHCYDNDEATELKIMNLTLAKRIENLDVRAEHLILNCDSNEIVKIDDFRFRPLLTHQAKSSEFDLEKLRAKFCKDFMSMKSNRTWQFSCTRAVVSFADYEYDFATHLDCLVNMIKWIRQTYVKRAPAAFKKSLRIRF